ncbi:unnamed protein product [Leptosia nina]|uniref:Ribosomal RNA-processing protein 7 C-terminal domain-containing protein n=1 Tax=Leptosia nina TaxID=320188 RepID=A0AAV1J9D2_9NEOP
MKSAHNKTQYRALELHFIKDSPHPHVIYFKEHLVREHTADKPSGRTLFVVNIPPYVDEQCMIKAFRKAGDIQSVQFSIKPNSTISQNSEIFLKEKCTPNFKLCYLVFKTVIGLDNALKLTELQPINCDSHLTLGLKKWINEYNSTILKPSELKDSIERFMEEYDKKTKQEMEKEKQMQEEDDEGWVTVTKRGNIQSFPRTEKVENKIMAKEEKSKKKKELKNFYTFQIRESKMKHIVSLRQKFEEDKKKIAQLKQSRRFKPF